MSKSKIANQKSKIDMIQNRIKNLWEDTDFALTIFQSLVGYAIIAADFDGNIIAYNKGAQQAYGYAPEDVIGKQNIEIFFPKDFVETGKFQEMIDDLLGEETVSLEGEKVRKNGEQFPAQILLVLTKDKGGKVVGFIEIAEDLTERKKAEKARAKAASEEARAKAERIEELERELRSLRRLSTPPKTSVTAQTFGVVPLRKGLSSVFDELVRRYEDLMEKVLEERTHKVDYNVSEELRAMAEELGFLKAGPRDVIEIYLAALKKRIKQAIPQKSGAYSEEGRVMALELMGFLVAFYRTRSTNSRSGAKNSDRKTGRINSQFWRKES